MKQLFKTSIFLTVLMLGVLTLNAQSSLQRESYLPLEEEGKIWRVMYSNAHDPNIHYYINYTIVNDTVYGILDNSNLKFFEGQLIRNSNSTAYTWFVPDPILPGPMEEWLMYNFAINEIGDKIRVGKYFEELRLDSITEVVVNDIPRRKYWWKYVEDYSVKETWIEGIGSIYGLHFSGTGLTNRYHLICVSQNGKVIFQNPEFDSCDIPGIGIEEYSKSLINIYPNPAKDILHINNIGNVEISNIYLINLKGQVLNRYNAKITEINVSDIPSGIYFLRFITNKESLNQKIVIE